MKVVGTMFFKDNTLKNEVIPYCLRNNLIK